MSKPQPLTRVWQTIVALVRAGIGKPVDEHATGLVGCVGFAAVGGVRAEGDDVAALEQGRDLMGFVKMLLEIAAEVAEGL